MVIKFSRLKSLFAFGVTLCLMLVCSVALGQTSEAQSLLRARVEVLGTDITGTLILTQRENGVVRIRGTIQGDPATLTPGLHGLHIHSVGVCEPGAQPPFTTSGGHFDPGPFGSEVPVQENHPYHLGDLPNLVVDEMGYANYNTLTSRVTLSEGPLSVFDDNGSAIIIHQLTDQQKAGGTAAEAGGGRLACGVVTREDGSYQSDDQV
ncbi:superoxide dismutase family protein [Mastigocladopsis repens]|uniref:superoxide dismutase family protein n=1 Tax=Mastigocladopsis repens TaxID=221287 RepID=UPI000369D0F8|nr:superoxide dismutase family protein [Mastigocladopsis repens]